MIIILMFLFYCPLYSVYSVYSVCSTNKGVTIVIINCHDLTIYNYILQSKEMMVGVAKCQVCKSILEQPPIL